MSVATKFVRAFDAISRAGGTEDFELGLSSLELVAPKAVQIKISNHPSASSVVLDWSSAATLGVHCSCSAFQTYPEPCHHIWTALLHFDKSRQAELIEARDELSSKAMVLKRLKSDEADHAIAEALDLKKSAKWPLAKVAPAGMIAFARAESGAFVLTSLGFTYGDFKIAMSSPRKEFLDRQQERRLKRNQRDEKELLKKFKGDLSPKKLVGRRFSAPELKSFINEVSQFSWRFQIDGRDVIQIKVTEARLEERDGHYDFVARFDDPTITLADAIGKPDADIMTLPNGQVAMLADEWAKRLELLSRGSALSKDGALRFSRTSLPLFKPVFEAVEDLTITSEAQRVFDTLRSLGQTGQAAPPALLKASLRSYQSEGLFWLLKMSKSGFGGILADDMGLGKTVQIIAYLLSRRAHFRLDPEEKKPCLVVLPKSLVANWHNEIEKFGPALLVLDFSGANRVIFKPQHFDVVLTTYHVMKNEVERLREVEFDTIILDEAQAIKNPTSQISKAVFQLQARQRFALSGTPVENSLRDLFSLMQFTNPGLIPKSFDRIYGERKSLALPKDVTDKIAASVRPFILRRTKKQVLKELPDKTEQVLMCVMETPQKNLYDKTRRFFRTKLKEGVVEASPGVEGGVTLKPRQTRVFEALLRLRQIACHPKLVGKLGESIESTKVEMLLEHLEDIQAAGNKALVFSQFTSFLDLLKPELEKAGIKFEHLDGQTRNRGAVVDRFNSNPRTTVFLISLKAGGTGLNLTTASYVFLMDPWWNPAIESQAIDRAYRMGQKQKVTAYRLIAKGTIEEKILKLQDQKRSLADSLISENSLGASLSLADLESLLEDA